MSYSSIVEQVFDEFQEYLILKLPKVLSDYHTEQPDLDLPMFRQIIRGDYQISQLKSNMFPAILVRPGTILINPQNEQRAVNRDLIIFNFSLWLVTSGNVSTAKFEAIENLQRVNERYAWAVKEIIDSPSYIPTQDSLINSRRSVTAMDWSAVETGNDCAYSSAYVDVELRTEINRV
jgi:hypothetical protein